MVKIIFNTGLYSVINAALIAKELADAGLDYSTVEYLPTNDPRMYTGDSFWSHCSPTLEHEDIILPINATNGFTTEGVGKAFNFAFFKRSKQLATIDTTLKYLRVKYDLVSLHDPVTLATDQFVESVSEVTSYKVEPGERHIVIPETTAIKVTPEIYSSMLMKYLNGGVLGKAIADPDTNTEHWISEARKLLSDYTSTPSLPLDSHAMCYSLYTRCLRALRSNVTSVPDLTLSPGNVDEYLTVVRMVKQLISSGINVFETMKTINISRDYWPIVERIVGWTHNKETAKKVILFETSGKKRIYKVLGDRTLSEDELSLVVSSGYEHSCGDI